MRSELRLAERARQSQTRSGVWGEGLQAQEQGTGYFQPATDLANDRKLGGAALRGDSSWTLWDGTQAERGGNWTWRRRGRGEGKEGVRDDRWVSGVVGRRQSHVAQKEKQQEGDELSFSPGKCLVLGDIMWRLLLAPGSPHPKPGETTEAETGVSWFVVVPLLTVPVSTEGMCHMNQPSHSWM